MDWPQMDYRMSLDMSEMFCWPLVGPDKVVNIAKLILLIRKSAKSVFIFA